MYSRSIQDIAAYEGVIAPGLYAVPFTSGTVDARGYRSAVFILQTGLWASGSLVGILQDAAPKDDGSAPGGSDYADVAGKTFTLLQANGSQQVARVAIPEDSARSFLRMSFTTVSGNPALTGGFFLLDPYSSGALAETWDLIV